VLVCAKTGKAEKIALKATKRPMQTGRFVTCM
jgi:hypothetical protein